ARDGRSPDPALATTAAEHGGKRQTHDCNQDETDRCGSERIRAAEKVRKMYLRADQRSAVPGQLPVILSTSPRIAEHVVCTFDLCPARRCPRLPADRRVVEPSKPLIRCVDLICAG